MIKHIITWLRRDDERLEILRREIQQKEKHMEWDDLQAVCLYVIYITIIMGVGALIAMLISL
jgi:hypothetical protein